MIYTKNLNIVWKDLSKAKNETVSIFNQMFNYTWFYSYFRYYTVFPISNEVPYQVKRDYKILDNESKWIVEYIKKMDSNWTTDSIVKDACSWVEGNCDLKDMSSKKVLWELMKNNDKILDLYRLTVMWQWNKFNDKLILVDNNFELDIWKYYWKESISACNSIKGWFFETITTAIQNIKLLNDQWADWIQMWRDTWDMMLWKEPSREALAEKELLRNYLSAQWITLQNQEIMQNNLDKYNEQWISKNNNFISNTISQTFWKIDNLFKYWKDAIISDFFNNNPDENINTNEIRTVTENSIVSKDLKKRISELYNEELPFAAIWDISTENLRAKIIQTHMSLDDSINILEKTIKISQKVCNSQDQKRWKCD